MDLKDLPYPQRELVILLHGLGRTKRSLQRLENSLSKAGYGTHNIDYPSRKKTICALSADLLHEISPYFQQSDLTVHFVTHSMGGLIIQELLSHQQISNLGKIVLIGTPIHGSEIADFLQNNLLYRWYYGPAGLELTTSALKNTPRSIFPTQVGVIAGNRSFFPFANYILPKNHDGRVSVESTKFELMKDHIVLPVNHTFMMRNSKVIEQVLYFLKWGHFNK